MMVYVSLYSREGVYPKRTKTAIDADCPKRARRRPPRPRTRYCQFFNGCIGEAVYGLVWDKVSRLQVRVFTAPSKCSVLNPKLLDWTANQVPRFCKEHRHDHHLDLKHPAKFKYNGEIQTCLRTWSVYRSSALPKCGGQGGMTPVYYDFPTLNTRRYVRSPAHLRSCSAMPGTHKADPGSGTAYLACDALPCTDMAYGLGVHTDARY
eukprot:1643957-Rhodomonas_salina.2